MINTGFDCCADRVEYAGPDFGTRSQSEQEFRLELRFGENTDDPLIADHFLKLAYPVRARFDTVAQGNRATGGDAEASLEVVVRVVEYEKRTRPQGRNGCMDV